MTNYPRAKLVVLTAALAMSLGGCGGDGDSSDGSAVGAETPGSAASSVDSGASAPTTGSGTTTPDTGTTTPVVTLKGSTGATLDSGCTTAIAAAPTPDASTTSSFGLTTNDNVYTVDTGAGLVFKIRRGSYSSNTQAPGDLTSMVYNGVEYQDVTSGTQINAGMGWIYTTVGENDVVLDAVQVDADHIRITVTAGDMTHYYLAHRGEAKIYMGTVFASEPNQENEGFVRYIVRALTGRLPNGPAASNMLENTATIEASDIFSTATGETRSKHYSNQRLRDWYYIGATGSNVGLWVVRGNSEGMSGGPFYRSLLNQGLDTQQQLTYIVNYGMAQTEPYRMNVLNTYALVFTDGSKPAVIDTSWYGDMGLKGWVASSARGTVSGASITGLDSHYRYTVGLSNTTAQYWTAADGTSGSFSCAGVIPGDYTLNVYKNELVVASQAVTVTAGGTTTVSPIAVTDPSSKAALWRIGDWDGSPTELRNGDKVTYMHPSDVRMASWAPGDFVVGTSANTDFPAYMWKDKNNGQRVTFTLTASQLLASTVRIGLTTSYLGARPQITVNGWSSTLPAAPSQPKTRSLTVGTYRGNNTLYTYTVPASALVVGTNTLTISLNTGSTGDGWLSPAAAIDAVDFSQ
ncbi:rhamnogalacturonan endolyase [Roseateles sp. YR242]|uniref:rhamnogalacturonan lyase B N-terminal domain-containing protein n=1 Tax=Roseateles sp. YR242 TaxID=1855305 RepID=UPI0008C8E47B|nr:rhamnogalacturonan lyase B N-terminal domain-containing protein [Roseateles sp. YR242]SEL77630.1 rhamnogalacturonan endolyase [Roseateles sp. YR242]